MPGKPNLFLMIHLDRKISIPIKKEKEIRAKPSKKFGPPQPPAKLLEFQPTKQIPIAANKTNGASTFFGALNNIVAYTKLAAYSQNNDQLGAFKLNRLKNLSGITG